MPILPAQIESIFMYIQFINTVYIIMGSPKLNIPFIMQVLKLSPDTCFIAPTSNVSSAINCISCAESEQELIKT
jgi:hypothetical protein